MKVSTTYYNLIYHSHNSLSDYANENFKANRPRFWYNVKHNVGRVTPDLRYKSCRFSRERMDQVDYEYSKNFNPVISYQNKKALGNHRLYVLCTCNNI